MKQRPALERIHVVVLVGWAVIVVALVIWLVLAWVGDAGFAGPRDVVTWGFVFALWGGGIALFCGGIVAAVGGVARFALAGRTSRTVFLILTPPLITLAVIGALWGFPWSN